MTAVKELTGLRTKDGKKIFSLDYINMLRNSESGRKTRKLYIAQPGPQEDGLHQSVDILVYGGNRGGGKANTYNTPVITPTGRRRMGDLEVGDLVCTPYDGVQKVEEIFEQGLRTVYVFHFDDDTTLECMDNHRFFAREQGSPVFKEVTAERIMKNYVVGQMSPNSLRTGKSLYEIPLCGEVEMNKKGDWDLPIHPFVLGCLLGIEGKTDYYEHGFWLNYNTHVGGRIHTLGYNCRKIYGNYIIKGIKKSTWAKLYPTNKRKIAAIDETGKHKIGIPSMYLLASPTARWEFLRGLFVFQGGMYKKHPYLDLQNKQIIEDAADMARSLGCFARTYPITDDPEKVGYFRLQLICPDDKAIWYLGVLKGRAKTNASVPKAPVNNNILTKRIMWIEKKQNKQLCRCITVSGRDHLYLTDAFTINHNTWVMLAEPFYDIRNSNFNGIIFRKNKDDFDNIIKETRRMYRTFGHYNRSADDMAWYFYSGAELNFSIYEMAYDKFDDKYRGQQFAYIGIDELPQMSFKKFKFLMTCNRNTFGIKSRMVGTCNPDPYSWLRIFIEWYLDSDGYIIPERSGKIRYFYSPSDNVEETVWGDSPQEVYGQCKSDIEKRWKKEYEKFGYDKTTFFVKSFSFIKADLKYNEVLLKNDPSYLANLMNQSESMKAREIDGCWNPHEVGDDLIKVSDMERCFHNDEQTGDGIKRASCDVAFTGGDSCVLMFWKGWHVADIFVCKLNAVDTCNAVAAKLTEWGVLQQNFVYDLNGLGQTFKGYFKHAVPFNNMAAAQAKFKNVYDTQKSQCAYMFAQRIQSGGISFNQSILERRFSGRGFEGRKLRDILLNERKAIKQDESKTDKGWCLIKKDVMKRLVGHSPDFIETMIMRLCFELKMPTANRSWVSNM